MADEEKLKASDIARQLKALREEQAATRKEIAALRQGIANIPLTDIHEAKQILNADTVEEGQVPCPKCGAPVDEDEAVCKNCETPLVWSEE